MQKLFLDAMDKLPEKIQSSEKFEAIIVGAESSVDSMKSSVWLQERLSNVRYKHSVNVNVPRAEAMKIIQEEGILLVFCTMVEVGLLYS